MGYFDAMSSEVKEGIIETRENPFNTTQGQVPVSEVENFWARMAREGTPKVIHCATQALNGSGAGTFNFAIDTGYRFYPKYAMVQIKDNVGKITFDMSNDDASWADVYPNAYGKFTMNFDGEFYWQGNSTKAISVSGGTPSGEFTAHILGVQVAE